MDVRSICIVYGHIPLGKRILLVAGDGTRCHRPCLEYHNQAIADVPSTVCLIEHACLDIPTDR